MIIDARAPQVPDVADVEVAVADDDVQVLQLLETFASRMGHPVRAFSDSSEALEHLTTSPTPILITDIHMPGVNGIDLVRAVRSVQPDLTVILVSGGGELESSGSLLSPPPVSLLEKPIGLRDFTAAVHTAHVQHAYDRHYRALNGVADATLSQDQNDLREITMGTLGALMNAMETRSPHFMGHSRAVALQSAAIAHRLGLSSDEIEDVRTAALLHDIGMIGVPDSVIDKPSKLTVAEYELIRRHPETGASILAPMRHLGTAIDYVAQHHERWDGSGYPAGLRGDEIPLGGQIVGISEAWVGIVESRAYRDARSRAEALALLRSHQDEWFSSEVTLALVDSDTGIVS